MKHAEIFTRLAQRADPNIPILEAAMEEIARLEEKLETSGYSPITEEVEDILRSKNQNLFNALMESKKRTGEQAAEITRLKAVIEKIKAQGLIGHWNGDCTFLVFLTGTKGTTYCNVLLYRLPEGD